VPSLQAAAMARLRQEVEDAQAQARVKDVVCQDQAEALRQARGELKRVAEQHERSVSSAAKQEQLLEEEQALTSDLRAQLMERDGALADAEDELEGVKLVSVVAIGLFVTHVGAPG
jgi:hypothetical protein